MKARNFFGHANLAPSPHKYGFLRGTGTPSADVHKVEWFIRTPDSGCLEGLDECEGEIDVGLHVLFP